VGRMGWNLYKRTSERKSEDPWVRLSGALESGEAAAREVLGVESKTWVQGGALTPEDFAAIRSQLERLEQGVVEAQDIIEILRAKGPEVSQSDLERAMARVLELKLRILDAGDVADSEGKGAPGGFFIPFRQAVSRSSQARKDLAALESGAAPDPSKAGGSAGSDVPRRAREIDEVLAEIEGVLTRLETYVKEGLARDDLTPEIISELGTLREELKLVGEARKRAAILKG
jgi:hypothetical protein